MNAGWVFGDGMSVLALPACGSSHRVSYSVPVRERAGMSPDVSWRCREPALARIHLTLPATRAQVGETVLRITQWFFPLGRTYVKPVCS